MATKLVEDKLPERIVIDASVLIAAVDPSAGSAEIPESRALLETMSKGTRRILIPAPALAEFYRGPSGGSRRPFPSVRNIQVVPFDDDVANAAADHLRERAPWFKPRAFFTPDSMIVATAIFYGSLHTSTCLVSTDPRLLRLARDVNRVRAYAPSDFLEDAEDPYASQLSLLAPRRARVDSEQDDTEEE